MATKTGPASWNTPHDSPDVQAAHAHWQKVHQRIQAIDLRVAALKRALTAPLDGPTRAALVDKSIAGEALPAELLRSPDRINEEIRTLLEERAVLRVETSPRHEVYQARLSEASAQMRTLAMPQFRAKLQRALDARAAAGAAAMDLAQYAGELQARGVDGLHVPPFVAALSLIYEETRRAFGIVAETYGVDVPGAVFEAQAAVAAEAAARRDPAALEAAEAKAKLGRRLGKLSGIVRDITAGNEDARRAAEAEIASIQRRQQAGELPEVGPPTRTIAGGGEA